MTNGLTQCIRIGKSVRLIWVKTRGKYIKYSGMSYLIGACKYAMSLYNKAIWQCIPWAVISDRLWSALWSVNNDQWHTIKRILRLITSPVEPRQAKKRPLNVRKMRSLRSSCACAKYHQAICSQFIHSAVSHDSVNGQWMPGSDCAHARNNRLTLAFAVRICPKTRFRRARPIFIWQKINTATLSQIKIIVLR